jgi:hypothetical protein
MFTIWRVCANAAVVTNEQIFIKKMHIFQQKKNLIYNYFLKKFTICLKKTYRNKRKEKIPH